MTRRSLVLLPLVVGALVAGAAVALEVAAGPDTFGREVVPGGVWIYAVLGLALAGLTAVLVATGRTRLAVGCAVFAASALLAALLRAHVHWSLERAPDRLDRPAARRDLGDQGDHPRCRSSSRRTRSSSTPTAGCSRVASAGSRRGRWSARRSPG